jgi:plastocyanin
VRSLVSRSLASLVVASGVVMASMTAGAAPGGARPAVAAKTHTVTIEGTAFSPVDLTVSAGDTIVWVNKDFYPHTATSKQGGFDSDDIAPEKSWKYVAKKKGDFPYICAIHPSMKATLHVK